MHTYINERRNLAYVTYDTRILNIEVLDSKFYVGLEAVKLSETLQS